MNITRTNFLHRFLPIYVPFLLLSIASAFMVYLSASTIVRHFAPCYQTSITSSCNQLVMQIRYGELVAELTAYIWFILAQITFYTIYRTGVRYSLKKQRRISLVKFFSSLYCLAVTASGFSGIFIFAWRLALPAHG